MHLVLQAQSEIPLYKQIVRQIALQISDGSLPPDFCLPSIRFVAKEVNVAIVTVKTAYEELEKRGYLYTLAGKGSFVSPSARQRIARDGFHLETKAEEFIAACRTEGLSDSEIIALLIKKTEEPCS